MSERILLGGNEAAVYGAILAHCDAFFGYPITPASEIIHCAAAKFPQLNRTFLQAESEIGAINMVMGAAAAGKRAMTGSSGLGISLMQESVSYLAGSELPCVILDIMRGGPGLGNIAPEQADYNQVVKGGGHGSYNVIVLAPDSVQEMCDMTYRAFDLAERYATPVYVLADGIIGQMKECITLPPNIETRPTPPKALAPGNPRSNYFTSIYMSPEVLEEHNQRLQSKYERIRRAECGSESYFIEDADVLLVAYGICARLARKAVDELRETGVRAGLFRPTTLFPFPVAACREAAARVRKIIVVEMSAGQLIDDVRLAVECRVPVELLNRMGGNLPTVREIVERSRK